MAPQKKSSGNNSAGIKKPHPGSKNLKPFKKGQSGNPKGRPKGLRDRRTVIREALMRIGQAKGMTTEEVEDAIQAAAIEKAFRGSFFHYQEISDGLYGKITDKVDVTSGGKTLADVIAAAAKYGNKRKTGGSA